MTAQAPFVAVADAPPPQTFVPKVILALVVVGVIAFSAMAVLSAYAPDLRGGQDGRAHALSKSAVGFAGAPILMKALGGEAMVSRLKPSRPSEALVVLTPDWTLSPKELQDYPKGPRTLIILPKWLVAADPFRRGFVRKVGSGGSGDVNDLLASYAAKSRLETLKGRYRSRLTGVGPFAGVELSLGPIENLQTISGDGWAPALVDGRGRMVLAYSRKSPGVWVLADPDLLNNQGLANLDTARAGVTILQTAREGQRPILFDVTLNGYARGAGFWRLMLEPPWLAATLIGFATALLMGAHAVARFGQPLRRPRAFALGSRALVDNSADLVRMARREHELAPAYASLTNSLVVRAGGSHANAADWLEHLAARRGLASPEALAAEAETTKTRDDLLSIARKLYEWRGEMTRERR